MDPTTSALLCTVQKALGAFCALLLFGRPAGLLDIAALLNCDSKTARKQLDVLVRQRLVSRQTFHSGYAVTERGFNFWFDECGKFSHLPPSSTPSSDLNFTSEVDKMTTAEEEAEVEAKGKKMGENGFSPKVLDSGLVKAGMSRERPGSCTVIQEELDAGWVGENRALKNLSAFREEGVGQNRRVQQVCVRPHVTPAYIHAQAKRLRREKRFHPGLLLLVVESEDPVDRESREPDSEDRYRYIRGKYAEFIAGGD